jgi:hypothetical protein
MDAYEDEEDRHRDEEGKEGRKERGETYHTQ